MRSSAPVRRWREKDDDVIVVYADTPLVSPRPWRKLREPLGRGAAVVALGFEARDPTGYGRLIMAGDELLAIREHKDATEEERAITLCNGGLMALRGDVALSILERIGKENAKGEYYLTDAVAARPPGGHRAAVVVVPEAEVHGVNDRSQLADAERMIQERLRNAAMLSGVTMVAPETVFLSHDTPSGPRRDRRAARGLRTRRGRRGGRGDPQFQPSRRRPINAGAAIGPFARLRPGAYVGEKAKVGQFRRDQERRSRRRAPRSAI